MNAYQARSCCCSVESVGEPRNVAVFWISNWLDVGTVCKAYLELHVLKSVRAWGRVVDIDRYSVVAGTQCRKSSSLRYCSDLHKTVPFSL